MFEHNPPLKRIWELASFQNPDRQIVQTCGLPERIDDGAYRFNLYIGSLLIDTVEVAGSVQEVLAMYREIEDFFLNEQRAKRARL